MSDSRLDMYVRTAGGAAALAAAGASNASIISSIGPESIAVWSFSNLFEVDSVRLRAANTQFTAWDTAMFYLHDGVNYPAAATFNWTILPSTGTTVDSNLAMGGSLRIVRASNNSSPVQSDLSLGTNVVAFSMGISASTYYGWINYSLSRSGNVFAFTINGWAYNNVSGQGIIAGQNTAAGSNAVPGMGGLAALAFGAAGVRSRRQRTVA